jgi:hypothetical protein
MAARKSKQAKIESQVEAASIAVLENEAESEVSVVDVEVEAESLEIFSTGDYTFEYVLLPSGTCYPVLKVKGDIFFSGWECKDLASAEALLISLYYQLTGVLKGSTASIRPSLLAKHPLSDLIYTANNTATISESFEAQGNRTDLFRVVVNPHGWALSGNTRLETLKNIEKATGIQQQVHAVVTDGNNDIEVILGGNTQREKTGQDKFNEAIVRSGASESDKRYWTIVRETYIREGFGGGGTFDAMAAVRKYVDKNPGSPFADNLSEIAKSNETIAYDLMRLQQATQGKDGDTLAPQQAIAQLGQKLSKMARIKNAEPVNLEQVYEGIHLDTADIRRHYTGETLTEISRVLMESTPDIRSQLIAAKQDGDKQKLSLLKAQLENPQTEDGDSPDWNRLNDSEAATEAVTEAVTAVTAPVADAEDSQKEYNKEMRKAGYGEDGCWLLNRQTADSLLEAIGGVADVDPFAEKGQNLKADRYILATERPLDLKEWGGGVHDGGEGLRVATSLPVVEGLVSSATEIFKRIESMEIREAAFVVEASAIFYTRLATYFKAIPMAWVVVSRESASEATEGFGFEPSAYLKSNARFKNVTADNWNEAKRAYLIVYFGKEYDRFERACGKYGVICYNKKAALAKSVALDWEETSQGDLTANHEGSLYEIQKIGDTYFLSVDAKRQPDGFKKLQHAQGAAILDSLGL